MKNKCTHSVKNSQHLIAGLLQNDSGIEFYGIPNTREVQWIQNGHSHSFSELPPRAFMKLVNAYRSNEKAQQVIEPLGGSLRRRVELYTYFMFGGLDSTPDMLNGELQQHENFRENAACISLNFKSIRLNGALLKERELRMIDIMVNENDPKDEIVAERMGIAVSTYNQHKTALFHKTGTQTKTSLLLAAMREKATRIFS